jgi:hypothetical protein
MAQLLGYGGDSQNHHKALAEFDTVDLEAISTLQSWGTTNGKVHRIPPTPCPRPDCGGSVLIWGDARSCILCGRPGDNSHVSNGYAELLL